MNTCCLGLDIGGANLKMSDGRGFARSVPFALWRRERELPDMLAQLLAECPSSDRLAVTMTGELADCFATKAVGVRTILSAVCQSAGKRHVSVYLCDGRLVTVDLASREPLLAAASNWHALAAYSCRFLHAGPGLLIDVGSTTCDVIPIAPRGPVTIGRNDTQRLAAGELVYTGVERSPIAAVVSDLPWRGTDCPVAQELFATTADAYLVLGELPAEPGNRQTADGRPRTLEAAHQRLARMICADHTTFSIDDAHRAAESIRQAQLTLLQQAVRRVIARQTSPPLTVVLSGNGEFLARRLLSQLELNGPVVSLAEQLGPANSQCAPAYALAVLAGEGVKRG